MKDMLSTNFICSKDKTTTTGIALFDACDIDMLDVVENGNYIQTKDGTKIPRSSWNEGQKTRYLLNSKPRNFLMCALAEAKYEKVTTLKESKNLKKLPMEELIGTLKVHEIELNEDECQRKTKSMALKA
ncbi:hypothetical protein CR513_21215, partial [Mucuna pruriens]